MYDDDDSFSIMKLFIHYDIEIIGWYYITTVTALYNGPPLFEFGRPNPIEVRRLNLLNILQ